MSEAAQQQQDPSVPPSNSPQGLWQRHGSLLIAAIFMDRGLPGLAGAATLLFP